MNWIHKDVLSRAAWTAAQALVALLITQLTVLSVWWAAPIAMLLSAIKTYVINKRVDVPETSSPVHPVREV